MKVQSAICLEDFTQEIIDRESGLRADVTLERGKEYTVSLPDEHGDRTVFTRYWFTTPGHIWGGAK